MPLISLPYIIHMCLEILMDNLLILILSYHFQKVSEHDQEIQQSHTVKQHTAPWGSATEH